MIELEHEYCCDNMYYLATAERDEYELLVYSPEIRSYDFILHGKKRGMYLSFYYCPWCGVELPKDLKQEWHKILKESFGIDTISEEIWMTLPQEFKTDEWWKKRKL